MSRVRIASLFVFAALARVVGEAAETATPARKPDEASPILATPSASEAVASTPAPRPRLSSPAVTAQLAAAAPKYEPPVAKPVEQLPDLREIDKPRNTIIRLPPYVVPDRKPPPVLKEREVMTPQAKLDLALKKFPGLRLGSFWIFRNDGIAMAMLAEEERLERMRELQDLAGLMKITDPEAGAKAKREVEGAFRRERDFGR